MFSMRIACGAEDVMIKQSGPDRRVQKTRALLHGALASLVHEKSYDDIVVKEIVGRANVGRSTFYAHYRDKDDLLARGIRDMLHVDAPSPSAGSRRTTEALLRFSLPFLEHVERSRSDREPLFEFAGRITVHEHLRRVLETVLVDSLRRDNGVSGVVSSDLMARHVAATFVLVLEWWLEHPSLSAREVDVYFRALVVPALER
jgi:AcrR family transcriptional regulator